MDIEALWALAIADAEHVGGLLRARSGPKAMRRQARGLLARAFAILHDSAGQGSGEMSESAEAPPSPPTADLQPAELLALVGELQQARAALGDNYRRAAWRIGKLWVRTPMPERLLPLCHVRRRAKLVAAIQRRLDMPLALSDERIQWMQDRCNIEQPGVVRGVRESDNPESERLLASELELIRKRGRSRFS